MAKDKIIKEQLTELLETYYNGSFSQMACDYIHATRMTPEEVEKLLETMTRHTVAGVTRGFKTPATLKRLSFNNLNVGCTGGSR